MKLIELASPFGVFLIGVLFLSAGFILYIAALSTGDVTLRDSAYPIENLGVLLMGVGVILYFIMSVAKKVFK